MKEGLFIKYLDNRMRRRFLTVLVYFGLVSHVVMRDFEGFFLRELSDAEVGLEGEMLVGHILHKLF